MLRYMTLLYEGSHSTNMVREAIRRKAQTAFGSKAMFSPSMASKSSYEGLVVDADRGAHGLLARGLWVGIRPVAAAGCAGAGLSA